MSDNQKSSINESAKTGTIANLKQTSQTSEDDSLQEKAVIGTLSTVACAAAPFAPYGTIAAAVIAAGIGIYKVFSSIEKEDIAKKLEKQTKDDLKKHMEVVDDAVPRILRRPTVPIDLYSGPPMYWIVTEDDMPVVSVSDEKGNDGYYLATGNKEVRWPCAWQGGSSLFTRHEENQKLYATNVSSDVDLRYVYQPLAPEKTSKPAICVFFWAVPIFFARLQQKFFEQLFPGAGNPKEFAPSKYDIFKNGIKTKRTKDEVCSDLMKEVFGKGCLDLAGNWFGKIGWVIPALATGNDEYAERYYGRTLWTHHLALQNIKYSDATKFALSGVTHDDDLMKHKKNKDQYDYSIKEFYGRNRRFNLKKGDGTRENKGSCVTYDAGWIIDLDTFLSRYHVKDPIFEKARNGEATILDKNNLYYLTRQYSQTLNLLTGDNAKRTTTSFSTTVNSAGGSLTYFQQLYKTYWKSNIMLPILGFPYDKFSISNVFNGSLSAAPYMMFVKGTARQEGDMVKVRPEISKDTAFSTYGFFDFDPTDFSGKSIPGITDIDKNEEWKKKYEWTRSMSIFPAVDPLIPGSNAFNNNYVNPWSYNWGAQLQEMKESSFYYSTFNYNFLTINGKTPDVYEIVKDRPPIQGEEIILLKEKYWGNASWAYELAKKNPVLKTSGTHFAIIRPSETGAPADRLLICQVSKIPMKAFESSTKSDSGLYYRTNLEENKPIVSSGNRNNDVSPFYCGRRADNRLQPLFKAIRDASVYNGIVTKDSGWEDCHQWSWQYPTETLNGIGRVSKKIYLELDEGIGRAGCSPSSIATGPTFWGDVRLYEKVYPILNTGTSVEIGSQGFEVLKTQLIWDTILEMQTGAYTRYSAKAQSVGATLAKSIENQFAAFSKNALGFYKEDIAKKCKEYGVVPQVYDSTTKKWKELTIDQAARLATDVMNAWFNGVFPKPKDNYQSAFDVKGAFNFDLCERVAKNHIKLKKWALNIGKKKELQDPNIKFPSDDFDINTFGLNKANADAIASYNDALSAKIEGKNPTQTNLFYKDKKESTLKQEKLDMDSDKDKIKTEHIVGGVAAVALTAAIITTVVKSR